MAKAKKTTATPAAKPARAAKPVRAARPAEAKARGIGKKFFKGRPVCRVTFTLPGAAAPAAERVALMGEFNNWSPDAHPMKRLKNGDFAVTVELEKGRSYRFRYIIDGWKYENDWTADRYEPNPYGGEDSVVDL